MVRGSRGKGRRRKEGQCVIEGRQAWGMGMGWGSQQGKVIVGIQGRLCGGGSKRGRR